MEKNDEFLHDIHVFDVFPVCNGGVLALGMNPYVEIALDSSHGQSINVCERKSERESCTAEGWGLLAPSSLAILSERSTLA